MRFAANSRTNSQGLNMLDRFLGSLFAEEAVERPTFGVKFSTYVEGCSARLVSPKGRVFLVMICHQFRIDRMRGRAVRIHHLYSIPLKGFRMQEVQLFVDKVNYCLIHLSPGDVKDPEYMFEWLYEKF